MYTYIYIYCAFVYVRLYVYILLLYGFLTSHVQQYKDVHLSSKLSN